MSDEIWKAILGVIGTGVTGAFIYLGARITANRSKEGVAQQTQKDANAQVIEAWEGLLQPYRDEVQMVRREQVEDRKTHRDEIARILEEQNLQRREMERLQSEVTRWKQVAKTIASWATQLRDEVLRLGGKVPATPEELLTLQAISEAQADKP